MKIINKLSYAGAQRKRVQRNNESVRSYQKPTFEKSQRERNDTGLTAEKLMLFIACVFNSTDQANHKMEKIKIIVKRAEKCLAIKRSFMRTSSKKNWKQKGNQVEQLIG